MVGGRTLLSGVGRFPFLTVVEDQEGLQSLGLHHFSPLTFPGIDDMGARIDDLEKSISELIQEAGAEDAGASTTAGTAPRPATGS